MSRSPVPVAAGLLSVLILLHAWPAVAAATAEYEVKAAFVYNFTHFAMWPPMAFDDGASPLRVCIAGDDPFDGALQATLRNEVAGGHPLTVIQGVSGDAARRCHVVFVPASTRNADAVLKSLDGAPVLTIGESDGFLAGGGMVRFVVVDGRVRFDVSLRPVMAAGLSLNSRLLQVARQVLR